MHSIKLQHVALIALTAGLNAHATEPAKGALPVMKAQAIMPSVVPAPASAPRKGTTGNVPRATGDVPNHQYLTDQGAAATFGPAFVFKGIHLELKQQELQRIVPTLVYTPTGTTQGLEVGNYSCGTQDISPTSAKAVPKAPDCNFTLGGEAIQSMNMRYWGNTMTMASITFAKSGQPKAQWQRLQDGINFKYSNMEKPFMAGVWKQSMEEVTLEPEPQTNLVISHIARTTNLYLAQEAERMSNARKERQARAATIAQDM